MKFKNGSSAPAPDGEALSRDYEQAQDLGEARLGQLGLYLPRLTHIDFLPLESLAHVYLRLEDIPVGMGCRRVPVGQYYLMAVLRDGGKRKAALADRARGDWALEQLRTLAPELRTAGSRAGIDGLFLRILWQERFPAVSYLSFWWRADFCLYSLNNYFQKVLDILAKVVIMQITICAALAVR